MHLFLRLLSLSLGFLSNIPSNSESFSEVPTVLCIFSFYWPIVWPWDLISQSAHALCGFVRAPSYEFDPFHLHI
jgi:hypothetical protein